MYAVTSSSLEYCVTLEMHTCQNVVTSITLRIELCVQF